jgi:hypothetical protein
MGNACDMVDRSIACEAKGDANECQAIWPRVNRRNKGKPGAYRAVLRQRPQWIQVLQCPLVITSADAEGTDPVATARAGKERDASRVWSLDSHCIASFCRFAGGTV